MVAEFCSTTVVVLHKECKLQVHTHTPQIIYLLYSTIISLSLSLYIYKYICTHIYTYTYIDTHIYIYMIYIYIHMYKNCNMSLGIPGSKEIKFDKL